MKKSFLVVASLFVGPLAFAVADTHPQLCSNIRDQVSEDCSEESNTFDPATNKVIKRTYKLCYEQDLKSTTESISDYLVNEHGIIAYDKDLDSERIKCSKN